LFSTRGRRHRQILASFFQGEPRQIKALQAKKFSNCSPPSSDFGFRGVCWAFDGGIAE
jgi:hypothetical protein